MMTSLQCCCRGQVVVAVPWALLKLHEGFTPEVEYTRLDVVYGIIKM